MMGRPRKNPTESVIDVQPKAESSVGSSELAAALVAAINAAKPIEKKTPFTRKAVTPWTPKDGSPKLKLKRALYQHGLLVDPDIMTNEEIGYANKLRPGRFMDELPVRVVRRRDRGIDIDYPVKTSAQRLKMINRYGIRNFAELMARCIAEAENPKVYARPDELDDF